MLSETGQLQKDKDYMIPNLLAISRVDQFIDRKWMIPNRQKEEENGELILMGQSFNAGKRKVLQIDGGDGVTMWVYLML